jgi:hypothetical protein
MKMENECLPSFRTKDFYHAVVLKALGFELLGLDRSEGKFSIFIFDDSEQKAEESVRKYWERKLQVEPRAMVDSIGELKTRLYSTY